MPLAVEKLPARSDAVSVTEKVPPEDGVSHSRRGLPCSTVALLRHTTRPPRRTVSETVEIFDSDSCTPARAPPGRTVDSSEIRGGVLRSAAKRWAVAQ